MTFPAQVVVEALHAFGYVQVRVNANSTTPPPTVLGRIVAVGEFNLEDKTLDHMAYNADGTSQNSFIHLIEKAGPKVEVTIDEVQDLDALTFDGHVVDVDFVQVFPQNPTKGRRLLMAKAFIKVTKETPETDKPSTWKLMIESYNDPGSPTFTYDPNYTV